jgi:signal transduction histidine kinase
MQDMVEATLAYARGVGQDEALQRTEIGAFLTDIRDATNGALDVRPGPEAMVQIKPKALRRALRNLIDNAGRYGRNPTLTWGVSDESIEILVEDDGPGIPDDRLRDVFQPFLRLEGSRSRETGGHGLGLSIARSIVLQHGGAITLSNRAEGGLCARIVLPVTAHQAAMTSPSEHPEARAETGFSARTKKV